MATIKSYTSVEQSRKLAEILPFESADMSYSFNFDSGIYEIFTTSYRSWVVPKYAQPDNGFGQIIPCWSLAALLDILPKDEGIDCSIFFGYYNGKGEYIEKWLCAFEKEGETTDDFIIETIDGSNPVDACYEMILKLHELKML